MSITLKLRNLILTQQIFIEHLLCPKYCSRCQGDVAANKLRSLHFRRSEVRQQSEKYTAYQAAISAVQKNEAGKEDKQCCVGLQFLNWVVREDTTEKMT